MEVNLTIQELLSLEESMKNLKINKINPDFIKQYNLDFKNYKDETLKLDYVYEVKQFSTKEIAHNRINAVIAGYVEDKRLKYYVSGQWGLSNGEKLTDYCTNLKNIVDLLNRLVRSEKINKWNLGFDANRSFYEKCWFVEICDKKNFFYRNILKDKSTFNSFLISCIFSFYRISVDNLTRGGKEFDYENNDAKEVYKINTQENFFYSRGKTLTEVGFKEYWDIEGKKL